MKRLSIRLLAGLLISLLALTTSAQQVAPLSKKAAEVKRKAETLSPNSAISVIPTHGEEEYGNFLSSGAEELTFYDVDRKTEVTVKYAEIKKIKNGYSGYNSVHGRHTDRTKVVIAVVAVAGVLGALIGAAASAKN